MTKRKRRRSRRVSKMASLSAEAQRVIRSERKAGRKFLSRALGITEESALKVQRHLERTGFMSKPKGQRGFWTLCGDPPVLLHASPRRSKAAPTAAEAEPQKPNRAQPSSLGRVTVSEDAQRLLAFRSNLDDHLSGVAVSATDLLERCAAHLNRYAALLETLECV